MEYEDIEIRKNMNEDGEGSESSRQDSKELEALTGMYDLLPDPYNDRFVKDLPLPPNKPMQDSTLFVHISDLTPVQNI